jgi:hypothetical protein
MQTCMRVQSPVVSCMSKQMCGVSTCVQMHCRPTFHLPLFSSPNHFPDARSNLSPTLLILPSSLRSQREKGSASKIPNLEQDIPQYSVVRYIDILLKASKPKTRGLPPKQPKFSSILPQPTSMFSGGATAKEGPLIQRRKLDGVVKAERGPLFFFASSLHHGSPSLSC